MEKLQNPESTDTPNAWDSLSEIEMSPVAEIVDIAKSPEAKLAGEFPSSTYLFHATSINGAKAILESGALMNAGAIYEAKLESKRKELESAGKTPAEIEDELKNVTISQNSGNEGISWSCNGIDALPGEEGHITGFVAAPELVLGDTKLVIPSRPAPYEMLQVSGDLNAEDFYNAKKQNEVWGYGNVSFGERATVDSGLMFLVFNAKKRRENPETYEDNEFFRSLLGDYMKRGGLPAEELRKHFTVTEDDHVKIDEQLFQQKFNEAYLPPSAVWIQAMIDKGMFKDTSADNLDVNGIINKAYDDEKLIDYMLYHSREEGRRYSEKYDKLLDEAKAVKAPVEEMYLVTNKSDLDMWMEEIERSGHHPKGILLYDEDKVKRPNFAQDDPGDHQELSAEIGRVTGADGDFWQRKLGMDLDNIPRAGTHNHVLEESAVPHAAEIRVVDGKLVVEKGQ